MNEEIVTSKNETVLKTLLDLRHVAEASGRTVSLSADNILDVLGEIEGRDKEIQRLRADNERLMHHVHASPSLSNAYVNLAETEIDAQRRRANALQDEVRALKSSAPETKSNGWVSVEDRKPPMTLLTPMGYHNPLAKQYPVLVATKEGRVFETIYNQLGFANLNSRTDYVTHWMPLPAHPSVVETTENPGAGAPGGVGVVDLAARSTAIPLVNLPSIKAGDKCAHCGERWLLSPDGKGIWHSCHTGIPSKASRSFRKTSFHNSGPGDRCDHCSMPINEHSDGMYYCPVNGPAESP